MDFVFLMIVYSVSLVVVRMVLRCVLKFLVKVVGMSMSDCFLLLS